MKGESIYLTSEREASGRADALGGAGLESSLDTLKCEKKAICRRVKVRYSPIWDSCLTASCPSFAQFACSNQHSSPNQ